MTVNGPDKSTIVRVMPHWVSALSHAWFGALEHIAPGLAARWALRLWLTPPHAPARRPTRQPALPPGERFSIPLPATTEGARRWRAPRRRAPRRRAPSVVAETWGEGPVVYLLHGWGGNRSHLAALVPPLLAKGLRVVAVDAPGHGESGPGHQGGRRTTLTEIGAALTAAAAVTGPARAVISHSGGCAATGLAVRDGLAADRLVFIAPMADPMAMLGHFAALLGLGPRSERRFQQRLERAAGRPLSEFDLPARATETDKLPPLLVIHDRDDRELPPSHGEAIAAAWPRSRLLTTSGLGHRRLLADPEVISAAVAFVTAARV